VDIFADVAQKWPGLKDEPLVQLYAGLLKAWNQVNEPEKFNEFWPEVLNIVKQFHGREPEVKPDIILRNYRA